MKPIAFDYFDPATLAEALSILRECGDEAKAIAGGQSLVPMMNFRLVRPTALIDLNRLASLDFIVERQGAVAIGALTRQHIVETSAIVRARVPLLAEALPFVAHMALRRRGTVGGSVAHADPAAEIPTVLVALGATVIAQGPNGTRAIPADEFFVSYFSTALKSDELLTELRIPTVPPGTGSAFLEVSRRKGSLALVSVAAEITLSPQGICERAALALGGVGSTPFAAVEEAQLLVGQAPNLRAFQEVGQRVAARISPDSDLHGSAQYRKDAAAALVDRALQASAARASAASRSMESPK